jgi:hypothetical protein
VTNKLENVPMMEIVLVLLLLETNAIKAARKVSQVVANVIKMVHVLNVLIRKNGELNVLIRAKIVLNKLAILTENVIYSQNFVVILVIMEKCALLLVKIIIVNIVPNVKWRMVFAANALAHTMEMIVIGIVVNVQMENVK